MAGATVNGKTSDSNGHISVTFLNIGKKELKAEKSDSIRSNRHTISVIWFIKKGFVVCWFLLSVSERLLLTHISNNKDVDSVYFNVLGAWGFCRVAFFYGEVVLQSSTDTLRRTFYSFNVISIPGRSSSIIIERINGQSLTLLYWRRCILLVRQGLTQAWLDLLAACVTVRQLNSVMHCRVGADKFWAARCLLERGPRHSA